MPETARRTNTDFAKANGVSYYTTEDQISVAKYNPYQPIQLCQKNLTSTDLVPYETTMKDVTSKIFPNGATAIAAAGTGGAISIDLLSLVAII